MRGPDRGRLGERGHARPSTFSLYTIRPKPPSENLDPQSPQVKVAPMTSKEWVNGFHYGIGLCFFTYSVIIALLM